MKDFILNNCFNIKGGFNNRVSDSKWWFSKERQTQLDLLLAKTSFLEDTASITQRCWHAYNDIYTTLTCRQCNNSTTFLNFKDGYRKFCSVKCATKDSERNSKISKFDRSKMLETTKKNNLEKYGVEYSFQREDVKNKSSLTKLKRYGDRKYHNRQQIEKTNLIRYGSKDFFSSDIGKETLKNIRKENKGSLKLDIKTNRRINNIEFLKKLNRKLSVIDIAHLLGVTGNTITNKFYENKISFQRHPMKISTMQARLLEDIKKIYNGEIHYNTRNVISPKELDFYFPDLNLAIELNGLYWHSGDEDKKFNHYQKYLDCKELGIRLIQITDKELLENRELVLNHIKNTINSSNNCIKIGARKCTIKEITSKQAKEFLNNYHFQRYGHASIRLGLFFKDELISVMTFSKPRFNKKYEYELHRLCIKPGYLIQGGTSRLFSHFIMTKKPKSIISYCDISKFEGNVYEKLGFEYSHTSQPNYIWYKCGKTLTRYQTQKHLLNSILDNFDNTISENDNMFNNNWSKYYDCGNKVYVISICS